MGNSPIIIFEAVIIMGNEHMYFLQGNIYIQLVKSTFINIDGNLFSPISKADGNLFAHITPKQVIYHFNNNNLDIANTNSMAANLIGRLCLIGNSWKIFDFFSQKHIINILVTNKLYGILILLINCLYKNYNRLFLFWVMYIRKYLKLSLCWIMLLVNFRFKLGKDNNKFPKIQTNLYIEFPGSQLFPSPNYYNL